MRGHGCAALYDLTVREREHFVDQIVYDDGLRLVVPLAEQPAQSMDHFPRAPVVGRDVLENGAQFGPIEFVSREHALGGSRIRQDSGKRLVELMRHRARQLTEERDATEVRELAPLVFDL